MAKAWARKEAKKNEVAAAVEKALLWIKFHPQASLWGGIGIAATALLAASFYNRIVTEREESWSRYAIIQSYAYSKKADEALEQVRLLAQEYPASEATSYAQLLAGDILYGQGKYKEAAAAFDKVVSQPNHTETLPVAMANLGISQEASGDCKTAGATAQRFLDTFADHFMAPQVHASLARCLSMFGEQEKARATYEKMAVLYPNSYWAKWAQDRIKG